MFVVNVGETLPKGGAPYVAAPLRENVWEITLAFPAEVDLKRGALHPDNVAFLAQTLEQLRAESNVVGAVSLVQMPAWREVAVDARRRWGWRIVYDCMDDWRAFPGVSERVASEEEKLAGEADLVLAASQALAQKWRGRAARVELVRNAADFARFAAPVPARALEGVKHPIVGFFGGIAPWVDLDLVARCAQARPSWSFVLVGEVMDVDARPLRALRNVHLLGDQPYERMPSYLRDFDVCIIPFVIDELTAAVDPVKFYEYLAQGKPVVSTALPELEVARDLIYLGRDADDFMAKLDAAVDENDPALRQRRIDFARANGWPARVARIENAVRDAHPRASIIIVSHNNNVLTRDCVDSVLRNSIHPNIEVIVVDNGSTDGTPAMLRAIADERVRAIINDDNAGFAAACNQGLEAAAGDVLVLMNEDIVVPNGWLPRMLRHLDDPAIGVVNAVTSFSGNESCIPVPYSTMAEMEAFAQQYMREHDGERFDIRVAAMYCIGMRRDVFAQVGLVDARFGLCLFEDDDYSHRVRLAGYRVVCAEDVFVHHYGHVTLDRMKTQAYEDLFERNKAQFEEKWGMRWQPHETR